MREVVERTTPDFVHRILERGHVDTAFGKALRVQFERTDGGVMSWKELWNVFAYTYSGRWGLQVFPPTNELIDQTNRYHLFVYPRKPDGLEL